MHQFCPMNGLSTGHIPTEVKYVFCEMIFASFISVAIFTTICEQNNINTIFYQAQLQYHKYLKCIELWFSTGLIHYSQDIVICLDNRGGQRIQVRFFTSNIKRTIRSSLITKKVEKAKYRLAVFINSFFVVNEERVFYFMHLQLFIILNVKKGGLTWL